MAKKSYRAETFFLPIILLVVFFTSCAHKPNITGIWHEPGKTSSIEFRQDGTFTAVDNMGMAVSGKYTLKSKGKIRLEIKHSDSPVEILFGSIAVQGDKLILTPEKDKEILEYRKIKTN